MKNVLIYTFASDRYRNYIPLWEAFIDAAYPEVGRWVGSVDCNNTHKKYYPACIRYTLSPPEELVDKYKYFYITDIDVMILRESPDFISVHKNNLLGGVYSNISRDATAVNKCGRLTGLHFFSREWFKVTESARSFYQRELDIGVTGNKLWDDEVILYKIAAMSNLPIAPIDDPFKFHHGIHLGNQRNIVEFHEQAKRRYMLSHISLEWAKEWDRVSKLPSYKKAKEFVRVKDKIAYEEVTTVEKYVAMKLLGR